eukprot:873458-Heterocapsa_arctica.AAC.1
MAGGIYVICECSESEANLSTTLDFGPPLGSIYYLDVELGKRHRTFCWRAAGARRLRSERERA